MLSSVPITFGGEELLLQFIGGDMFNLEGELAKLGLPPVSVTITQQSMMQRLDTLCAFLYVGLKKPNEKGELIRLLPRGPAGIEKMQDMIRVYSTGKLPPIVAFELGDVVFRAVAASEWFNFKEIVDEASTSVPQKVEPSKNSEGTGSKRRNR